MDKFKIIDEKIQEGYGSILNNDYCAGCDTWLEAWDLIKDLFTEGFANDIFDLDKKYSFTQFISNYTQDMEMELHNAGLSDKVYHEKKINYCRELLQWCGKDGLIIENTRRGLADAHFYLGKTDEGDELYKTWLENDPGWGWGYIGWSSNYHFGKRERQYEKAEEILLTGYACEGLRDRVDLAERLMDLYDDMDRPDKVKEYEKIIKELTTIKPVQVVKVGRNEPCPCGSGKKYKKCCLS
jgi:tetratricopeptide (TPR) repeat protein